MCESNPDISCKGDFSIGNSKQSLKNKIHVKELDWFSLHGSHLILCLLSFCIVTQAYNAFANRVASLKRKLDSLKSTLPGPEDSPIPSPSEDAPSPTGSDSPFMGMSASRAQVDPELDGKAMDEGEMHNDNRDMEDMDMSDEETDGAAAGG